MKGAWGGMALLCATAGGVLVKNLWRKKYAAQGVLLRRSVQERDMLRAWLLLKQQGARLEEYFVETGCRTVAVLGMGWEGRRAIEELGDMAAYGIEIDQPGAVHERLTVFRLGDDPLPPSDCVLICDLERMAEKRAAVQAAFSGEVVSLVQVLFWLQEKYHLGLRDGVPEGWPPEGLT